ncbi:hypothetical protein CRI94_13965 [Longibacter salinarum]|uniref:Sulfotransferase domain-containing protein n=1 Tax=Longibacter salinarum TaxID=1850348 RepID=A0A2A8CVJ4_9BACT|nr:sulfotransferase domain-containing protein [Longibacter salinarum]PEN12617.1 hypothetical protein CRI94_13965 [Longibacter salinarum]
MKTIRPTFLICGAKKAGTTALANYLREHPDVIISHPKETNYFRDHYEKGIEWLSAHYEHYDGETAVGEASVWNMYAPRAARRIHDTLPNARLIFVLRDPVSRAFSQYYYDLRCGLIEPHRTFEEVVHEPQTTAERDIIEMGFYDEQLKRFTERFDREQILILLSRDLRKSTQSVLKDVARFIRVDPDKTVDEYPQYNQTRYIEKRGLYRVARALWRPVKDKVESRFPVFTDTLRSRVRALTSTQERPTISDSVQSHLSEVYTPHIKRLEKITDLDFSHWT